MSSATVDGGIANREAGLVHKLEPSDRNAEAFELSVFEGEIDGRAVKATGSLLKRFAKSIRDAFDVLSPLHRGSLRRRSLPEPQSSKGIEDCRWLLCGDTTEVFLRGRQAELRA